MLTLNSALAHRQEMDGNIYKVYGIDFQNFINAHQYTLVALHDDSSFSRQVISTLHKLSKQFLLKNIPIKVAKMSVKEATSYVKFWNVQQVPHVRLYIGSGVYDELRVYPSKENLYDWSVAILDNPEKITLIDSEAKVEKFNKEKFAFYLRFPAEQSEYIDLLKKFQKLDKSLKVYYANKAAFDAFESFNPKDLVVGFRRTFDEGNKFLASEKKLNLSSVHNFFELFRHPDIHFLTPAFASFLKEKQIRAIVLFYRSEASALSEEFKKAAAHHKQKIYFVLANVEDLQAKELANLAQVEVSDSPQIRILDTVQERQRLFEVKAANAAEITLALEKYANKELTDLLEVKVGEDL